MKTGAEGSTQTYTISKAQDYQKLFNETSPQQYSKVLEQAIITCKPALPESGFGQWLEAITRDQKDAVFKAIMDNMAKLGGLLAVIKFAFLPPEGKQQLQEMLLKLPLTEYADALKDEDDQGNTILHYLAQAKSPLVLDILNFLPTDEARVAAVKKKNKANPNCHILHNLTSFPPEVFRGLLKLLLLPLSLSYEFEDWYRALKGEEKTEASKTIIDNIEHLGGLLAVIKFAFGWPSKKEPLQKMLLELPPSRYGDVLNEKDERGNTILHYLAKAESPVVLNILNSLSNDEARVEAVQKQNKENCNVLHELASHQPKAFLNILEMLPPGAYAQLIKQVNTGGHTFLNNLIKGGEDFHAFQAIWTKLSEALEPKDLLEAVQADNLLHLLVTYDNVNAYPGAASALQIILKTLSSSNDILLAAIQKKDNDGNTFLHILAQRNFEALKDTLATLPPHLRLAALSEKNGSGMPLAMMAGLPYLAEVLRLVPENDRFQILMLKYNNNCATVFHRLAGQLSPHLLIKNLQLLPKNDPNWQTAMESKSEEGRSFIEMFLSWKHFFVDNKAMLALVPPFQNELDVITTDAQQLSATQNQTKPAGQGDGEKISLHRLLSTTGALLSELYLLPTHERLTAIQELNPSGDNVLHVLAITDPKMIPFILLKLPRTSYLNLLQQPNQSGDNILTLLNLEKDESLLVLIDILNSLDEEERVTAIEKQNKDNRNVLHELARFKPQAVLNILEVVPPAAYATLIKQVDTMGNTFLTYFIKAGYFQALHATWTKLSEALEPRDLVEAVQAGNLLDALAYNYTHPGAASALQIILKTLSSSEDILLAAIQKKDNHGFTFFHILAEGNFDTFQATLAMLPNDLYLAALSEESSYGTPIAMMKKGNVATVLQQLVPENNRLQILMFKDANGATVLHHLAESPDLLIENLRLLSEEDTNWQTAIKSKDRQGRGFIDIFLSKNPSVETVERVRALVPPFQRENITLHELALSWKGRLLIELYLLTLEERLNAIQEKNNSGDNVLHVLAMSDPENIPSILSELPSASYLNLLLQTNQSGEDILTILKGHKDRPELLLATWRVMTQKWLDSSKASETYTTTVMRAYDRIDKSYTGNMFSRSDKNLSADGQSQRKDRSTEVMLLVNAVYEAYLLLEQEVLTAKKIPGHETSQSLTAASQQAIDERVAYLNKCADNLKSFILAGSLPKRVFIQLCRFVGAIIGGLLFFAVGVRNGAYYGEQAACKLLGELFFKSDKNLYQFAQTVSTYGELRRAQISGGALQQFVNHYRDTSRVLAFFGAKPSQPEEPEGNPEATPNLGPQE